MKKLIALVLAVLMVASMAAIFSFAGEPTQLEKNGYPWNGFQYQLNDGKYVAGFGVDFDQQGADWGFKSTDIATGFTAKITINGTEKEGKVIYTESWSDTDAAVVYDVTEFTLTKGTKYTVKVVITKDDKSYFVEYADQEYTLDPVPAEANKTGTVVCDEGSATYKYDKATHTLTITGDGAAVIKGQDNNAGYEFGGMASYYAKKIVITGVKSVGKNLASHYNLLEEVQIGEGCEVLGGDAFGYVKTLKTVYLPKTITTINQGVVYSSDNIEKVYFAGTEDEYKEAIKTMGAYNDAFGKQNQVTFVNEPSEIVVYNTAVPTGDLAVIATIVAVVALAAMAVVVKKVRV